MYSKSPSEVGQRSFFDLMSQLDAQHPLIALSKTLDWSRLENEFASLYSDQGRPAKLIRLMCGLLMLKQLESLSDESVVKYWRMNPYYHNAVHLSI